MAVLATPWPWSTWCVPPPSGAAAVAISPMHAMFSADTERFSPYSPSSRLFLNSLYASPACILGEREVRNAIEAAGLG